MTFWQNVTFLFDLQDAVIWKITFNIIQVIPIFYAKN